MNRLSCRLQFRQWVSGRAIHVGRFGGRLHRPARRYAREHTYIRVVARLLISKGCVLGNLDSVDVESYPCLYAFLDEYNEQRISGTGAYYTTIIAPSPALSRDLTVR